MNYDELYSALDELASGALEGARLVSADELGLDSRCGMVYVGEDFIATKYPRQLDYYGAFEYVDEEYILQIGPYKFYYRGDSRIDRLLNQEN